jgi:hypothetical protein
MSGALVPAPVVVHFKFGGESAHSAVTVPFPATPKAVCASILAARGDVRAMLADAYVGFELAVCDPNGGRPMAGDAAAIASETKVEVEGPPRWNGPCEAPPPSFRGGTGLCF